MPWGAAVGAIGSIASGVLGGSAAKSAAQTQAAAAQAAAGQADAERQPWLQAGTTALGTLSSGLAPGGQFSQKFSLSDATNSPAEQFSLSQGLDALNSSAAAKGQLLGTNNQQQNVNYAEGVASTYENQAFNQWMTQQNQQLGATQSLAGVGQTEAGQVGDTNANATLAAGGATAGGQIGAANATTGMISNLGNIASGITPSQASAAGSYLGGLFGFGGSSGEGIGQGSPVTADAPQIGQTGGTSYNPGADSAAAGDWGMSDERLKDNVHHVGYTKHGTPIYKYKLKGSNHPQMGVMAQDIEKSKPSAVKRHPSGYKMVDYAQVE
jgi:hypothetical protein